MNVSTGRSRPLTLALLPILFVHGTAGAQESRESRAQPIEEIVVTARYRQERVQDAPLSVTAFNEAQLEAITALDLRDVGPASPNVRIQPVTTFPNSAAIHVRGMGQQNIESTNEMRVGVSVNGVFMSRPVASLIDFFDVESVEVLRGPQGTTFGKNSLAGGINVHTIRPDGNLDYKAELTAGNYGRLDFRGAVQAPIVEDLLSARVSVLLQNYDGHFTNIVTEDDLHGEDMDSVRGTLVFTPTPDITATVIGQWLKARNDPPGGTNDPDPGQLLQVGAPSSDPFRVGRDAPEFHNTDQWGLTAIVDWDFDLFTLTSVTGYVSTDDFIASDFDQTEVPFFTTFREQEHSQFSQELRLHSNFMEFDDWRRDLDLVFGLYYFEQEHELVQSFPQLGPSSDYAEQDNDSRAVFGQAIYAVTDDLNLTFGVRHTREKKNFRRNPGTFMPDLDDQDPSTVPSLEFMRAQPTPLTGRLSSTNTSFKTGFDYRFTDDLMAYFSFTQGFKAGEFGPRASSQFAVGPTDDEKANSFEIGVRSEWLEGRLQANATAFHTNFKNLQFDVFIPSEANPTGQETATQNIGEATNRGLELELLAVPIDRLRLRASVGYLDAGYDSFCASLTGPVMAVDPVSECGDVLQVGDNLFVIETDNSDLELSRAPEWQLYLSADYTIPTRYGNFFARAAGDYESSFFTDGVGNHPKARTGGFWLLDASAGWRSNDERWRVQLWCKNCTDKTYVNGFVPTAQFFNQKFFGYPRTYGVTFAFQR